MEAARAIRRQVFVEEQGIPVVHESDGKDDAALHVVAVDRDTVVGTGRLIQKSGQTGVIGRVAVVPVHRRQGLATEIMHALEAIARERGITHIKLFPHDYLEQFYRGLGYRTVPGGEFMIESHRVLTMEKQLVDTD